MIPFVVYDFRGMGNASCRRSLWRSLHREGLEVYDEKCIMMAQYMLFYHDII